jgi:hypothetical protein
MTGGEARGGAARGGCFVATCHLPGRGVEARRIDVSGEATMGKLLGKTDLSIGGTLRYTLL